ncbi:MAG: hypothetical protein H6641_03230 [Caldilineaceae bacterium]|nr:hypothetical protein [Caldilineaceae bacterium]
MSVHQESIKGQGAAGAIDEAPELEYSIVRQDSLAMFGAAVGGAILGMLLTLLVLAIVNNGTLRYSSGNRLDTVETAFNALSENVNTNTANLNTLGEQVTTDLATLSNQRQQELGEINSSLATLNVTRRQFDTFMGALSDAMSTMQGMTTEDAPAPAAEAAPAQAVEAEAAPATTESAELAVPLMVSSADLPADELVVLPFVDANGNGQMDEGETNELGVTASLLGEGDHVVATLEATDAGITFEHLSAGTYQLVVEDTHGMTLLSADQTTIDIAADATEGQIVYIPLAGE